MSGSESRIKSMQVEQPFANISILKYLAPEINDIETALFDYCKAINSTTIRIKILSDFFGSNICSALHLIDKNKYLIHQSENGRQIFEFTEESFEIFCAVEISFCTSCSKEFDEPQICKHLLACKSIGLLVERENLQINKLPNESFRTCLSSLFRCARVAQDSQLYPQTAMISDELRYSLLRKSRFRSLFNKLSISRSNLS